MNPPDPSQIKTNIAPRAYWQESQPCVLIEQPLTFELNKFEAWSFPRTQLVGFEIGIRPIRDVWVGGPEKPQLERLSLVLHFFRATMIIHTKYPDALLEAVMSARVSVLARGPAVVELSRLEPEETPPVSSEDVFFPNYLCTGRIKTIKTPPDKL